MEGILILVKQTLRLLLRNKGFLFFILLLPVASIGILNLKDYSSKSVAPDENQIYHLDEMNSEICYMASNTMLSVKIYDSTVQEIGYLAGKELAKAGLFQIFYYNSKAESFESIEDNIDKESTHDHVGGIIYFGPEFASELMNGELKDGLKYYDSHEDDRTRLLKLTLSKVAGRYLELAKGVEKESDVIQAIAAYEETQPVMKQVLLETGSEDDLTYHQQQMIKRIGYMLAILTIGYLYSGVFIADTVIKEKQFKVYNRIKLTDLTASQYILSKYIVSLFTVVLQTIVIAIALPLIVHQNYGVSMPNLLFIIFMLGIIFNTMSLCIGILCNDVMNTNYISFVVWSLSCLLSGSYFDLSSAGTTMKRISGLMPQKWGLEAAKRIMSGSGGGYRLLIVVTLAYLMLIGVFAVIGTTKSAQE